MAAGDNNEKIRAIVGDIVRFGVSSDRAQIKNLASAILEVRDATDAGYAIMRGATPVNNNDYATKGYVDGVDSGDVASITVPGAVATPVDSTAQIPAGAIVNRCMLTIDGAYSAGTISVGLTGGTGTEFMVTGDNDPTTLGNYNVNQRTIVAGADTVRLVITGGVGGTCDAYVYYSNPQA